MGNIDPCIAEELPGTIEAFRVVSHVLNAGITCPIHCPKARREMILQTPTIYLSILLWFCFNRDGLRDTQTSDSDCYLR